MKVHYPKKLLWRKGYFDIRSFFKKHGFKHLQGSMYESLYSITDKDVYYTSFMLAKECPWINFCVNKYHVTNIGDQYDLKDIFDECRKVLENDRDSDSYVKKIMDIYNDFDVKLEVLETAMDRKESLDEKIQRYEQLKEYHQSEIKELEIKINELKESEERNGR